MSFTAKYIPYSRQKWFTYYASAAASMSEDFNPGFAYELESVRLHLSTAHASVVDFNAVVSAAQGSRYDLLLFSQAMNGVKDLLWQPTRPYIFDYNDHIDFSMIMSAANNYGLTIVGWAVTEP